MNLDTVNNRTTKNAPPTAEQVKRARIEGNIKNLLFTPVLWYKLSTGFTWLKIAQDMEAKGIKYSANKLRRVSGNWSASNIVYFYNLYNCLDLPTPTPELLLYWNQEIKRIEAERAEARRVKREKVQEGKLREAERIAQGGTPRKHNDRRK